MIKTKNNIVGSIKPKLNIAGKINKTIEYISPNNQEKNVIPTKEIQEITPDEKYNGLSKVIVDKIPDEYIIPSGEINISQNGTYDVTDKTSAKVNVPEKQLGTKTITSNGTYNATDDNLDGYSEVKVATSGVDLNDYFNLTKRKSGNFTSYIKQIPLIDTSDYTIMSSMFSSYISLTTIPLLDTNKVTNMNTMFFACSSLTTIPQLDTSNVTDMNFMFNGCSSLTTIPQLDTSKVTNISYMFNSCSSLTTLGGFTNLGQAYSTTQSANYSNYTLILSSSTKLTHDSLMNVINNLYDIASKGIKTQQLVLGSKNLAKLTAEEIAIATEKG